MAMIYEEDWSAGPSDFETIYRYEADTDGIDPLYPFIIVTEGVYIDGDGRVGENPAWVGSFQDWTTAGVWVGRAGGLDVDGNPGAGGYWNGDHGCIEVTYFPSTASLTIADGEIYCPLIQVVDSGGFYSIGIDYDSFDPDNVVLHIYGRCEGPDLNVDIPIDAAVADEAFTVRLEWQCGTMDLVEEVTAADGFLRVWINDALIYETTDIALFLWYPETYGVSLPNILDGVMFGYAGLIGAIDNFHIEDSVCTPAEEDVEVDLEEDEEQYTFDPDQKQTIGLIWVDAWLPD